MIRLRLCFFGKTTTEVMCPSQYPIRRYMLSVVSLLVILTFVIWLRWYLSCLHYKVVIFSFVIKNSLKETLWDFANTLFSDFLPIHFSIHQRILSVVVIRVVFQWHFSICLIFSSLNNWNFSVRRIPPHEFIHSFSHLMV